MSRREMRAIDELEVNREVTSLEIITAAFTVPTAPVEHRICKHLRERRHVPDNGAADLVDC
jgi:hypothetical protein